MADLVEETLREENPAQENSGEDIPNKENHAKTLSKNDQLKKKRRVDVYFIVVLILYLVLQMSAVYIYGDSYYLGDLTTMNDNDDVKYVRTALALNEEHTLKYQDEDFSMDVPSVFIMPGYPLFMAAFLKIFGLTGGLLAIRLVQCLLQIGVILLLYLIGKKYFNVWTARLAITFYLFYIPNLSVPMLILTEAVFTFLFMLLIYLCLEAIETKQMKYYVWGGIVLGLAAMIRPTILLFPVVILLLWLLKKYTVQEMLKRALVVGCILIVIFAPWWIRNAIDFGRFIPLTEASGDPFMQGAFIDYDWDAMSEYLLKYQPAGDAFEINQQKSEIGKIRLRDSWEADPLAIVHWYTVGKFTELWRYPYYLMPSSLPRGTEIIKQSETEGQIASDGVLVVPDDQLFPGTAERDAFFSSSPERLTEGVYCLVNGELQRYTSGQWDDYRQRIFDIPFHIVQSYHYLLLVLACLGTVMMFLKGESYRRLKLLLPVSILYSCVVYLPYFTMSRYAYPLMPLIFLLAAVGVCNAALWLSKGYKEPFSRG